MKIIQRSKEQSYWVVRAQGGRHYLNFLHAEIAAIGHLDHLNINDSKEPFFPNKNELLESLIRANANAGKKLSEAQIQNHYNQVIRFIFEIKVGDWIICPTDRHIHIGRVISDAFIDKKVVEVVTDSETGASVRMHSSLRRKVLWGPKVKRDDLPFVVNKALRANLSVFSLNDHWDLLYHVLYPFFICDNKIYFSIKIKQKESIDNYSISHLLTFLSEAEAESQIANNPDMWRHKNFSDQFHALRASGSLHLQTKAQFMSPGDIFANLPMVVGITEGMLWFYIVYSALFGSEKMGWKGLIHDERQELLLKFISDQWVKSGGKITKESLKLEQSKYDTKMLEDHSKDSRIQVEALEPIDLEKVFNRTSD
jgi:hypothetical protein